MVIHDGPQPLGQRLPGPVLRRVGDELRIVAGMTLQRICLLIAAAQLLLRKLADGLVHAVAPVLGISPKHHQRMIDQFSEDVRRRALRAC